MADTHFVAYIRPMHCLRHELIPFPYFNAGCTLTVEYFYIHFNPHILCKNLYTNVYRLGVRLAGQS